MDCHFFCHCCIQYLLRFASFSFLFWFSYWTDKCLWCSLFIVYVYRNKQLSLKKWKYINVVFTACFCCPQMVKKSITAALRSNIVPYLCVCIYFLAFACVWCLEGWLKPKIATWWCIQSITITLSDLVDPSSLHASLKLSLSSPLHLTECLHPFSHLASSLRHLPALWGRFVCICLRQSNPWPPGSWVRGLSMGLYQTGQLAWLNQMQLRRLRLALSVYEAWPRVEASNVNNGGVGDSLESSSLQTCSRSDPDLSLPAGRGSSGFFF